MRLLFVPFVVVLLSAQHAHAECRADFDGSGAVDINELIGAVNEALNGCDGGPGTPTRQPTPTRTPTEAPDTCPYRFNQAVDTDRFCAYEGRVTSQCDPFDAASGWTTFETDVIVVSIDEFGFTIALDARRTNPTTARVYAISFEPDFEPFEATGTLSLPSATRLGMNFSGGTTCGTFSSTSTFTGLVGDNAITASVGAFAGLRAAIVEKAGTTAAASSPERVAAIRALRATLRHSRE